MALPPGSKLTRQKRLMMTPEDDARLHELANAFAEAMDTTVKVSHILRACIRILRHARPELLERAEATRLRRPPNENHDALEDFEHRLARTILVAFKRCRHMK